MKRTGDTVLQGEDKLDDGSPIVLKVTINGDNVSFQWLLYTIISALHIQGKCCIRLRWNWMSAFNKSKHSTPSDIFCCPILS